MTEDTSTTETKHEIAEKTLGRETKFVCKRCRQYDDDRDWFDSYECRFPKMGHLAEASDS
jgi:hypothetical protein